LPTKAKAPHRLFTSGRAGTPSVVRVEDAEIRLRMMQLRPSKIINISGGVRTAKGLYFSINHVSVHGIDKFWQFTYLQTNSFFF
jgi:hypothetical protein